MFSSFSQISLSFLQLSRSMKLFHSSSKKANVHETSHINHLSKNQGIFGPVLVLSLTWKDLLQVIYDGDTIFIFNLKVGFGIDSLFTIVWSHDAVHNPNIFILESDSEQSFHYILLT